MITEQAATVGVVGCGYLGATHAAALASLGFRTVGVEVNPDRLESLRQGQAPFYEPELNDLLHAGVSQGRLRFTDDLAEAARCDVIFLCLATPQRSDGLGADLSQLHTVIDALGPVLSGSAVVVGKSTVPVGTARVLAQRLDALLPEGVSAALIWNPEFLREGRAVADTLRPDRLVFGVPEGAQEALDRLLEVFEPIISQGQVPVQVCSLETAELAKVAANAFLATKISFINALADVCDASGASVTELADCLGLDPRIGRPFLNAGLGFGGGCLPKDIRGLVERASELGATHVVDLMTCVDQINLDRRERAVGLVVDLLDGDPTGKRVAILGGAFKPDSDDIRDSPALDVALKLHTLGVDVVMTDPHAVERCQEVAPHLRYSESAEGALRDADAVALLTEWKVYRDLDPAWAAAQVRRPRILDARNVLDVPAWTGAGWRVRGMGRSHGE